ncbi:MAG: LVIVD repeat-containing protein [Candidatus Kariarchaeaceae archaeon]|jgi:hypothetical protein
MLKFFYTLLLVSLLLLSCGTPIDPESIDGNDGGYKIVSKFSTAGYAQDVLVDGTIAYVIQGEGGLMIINISNPLGPEAISTVNEGMKGYAYKVARKDSVLYIASGGFGVSTVNVVDAENPQVTVTNLALKPARNFHVMGEFLFTAIGELGIQIAEISYATQPDIRGGTDTPGYAQGVCASADSNYLLVACGEMGFGVFDISELENGFGNYPMIGWVDTPGYAEDVVSHPDFPYAYIASGTGGMIITDFSDSTNVKIVGSYSTGGYAKEILYREGKVYVTTELRGLQIINVSNVTSPVLIGTVKTEYAKGLDIDNNYIYVADEDEGLITISIP